MRTSVSFLARKSKSWSRALNDHPIFPVPLLSLRIEDDMALFKSVSEAAGMVDPPDHTAECNDALVVCVSLWSLSLKFSVPESVCADVEPVALEFSLKLPLADEDVNVGLWFAMTVPLLAGRCRT